ncbi:uncharacterized protein LOC106639697 [Copidosoma floridanum]|uniref:uncharacterized protein LOC106639697 n=1 Tax=Copidosoma floridanum TaxID=29053 RepID=UPI0006C9A330|nr:uncharacterized protein LOC106639697 [Copidosoma floridanum]
MMNEKLKFCDADESSLPPPIPPRRKRCKSEVARHLNSIQSHAIKCERKHRSAPHLPTPPQRSKTGKKVPASSQNHSKRLASSFNLYDSLECNISNHDKVLQTTSFEKINESDYNGNDTDINIVEDQKRSKNVENQGLDFNDSSSSRSSSPFFKSSEPNKYPPLYFTFEDYKMVVQECPREIDRSTEYILEKTEETSKKIEEVSENFDEITKEVKEINEKIEEISEQAMLPFAENVPFENIREEIYFRVTTTNRPFEQCLGQWNTLYTNDSKLVEEEQSDKYIFEDYLDRSKQLNRPQILKLNEEFCSIPQDENSASTEKSTTKVRFIIESPSTSTPDIDLDDDGSSYINFIEKKFLSCENSSVQSFEIIDEDFETVDKKGSNIKQHENDTDTTSKFYLETVENKENMSDSLYTLTTNPINDSCSEWEEDFDIFSSATFIEDKGQTESLIEDNLEESKNTNVKHKLYSELHAKEKVSNKMNDESSKKRTKLIDSSFYNLSEEDEWELYFEKDQVNLKEDRIQQNKKYLEPIAMIDQLITFDDRDDTVDNTEKNDNMTTENIKQLNIRIESSAKIKDVAKTDSLCNEKKPFIVLDLHKIPIIEISPAEDKPVPENTPRNSFLETMLNGNNLSQNSWVTSTANCEVVATQLKQDMSASANEIYSSEPLTTDVNEFSTETAVEPTNKSSTESTESSMRIKALEKINTSLSKNTSAGEVKGDVLDELLANFSAIKLKPVKTTVHTLSRLQDYCELDKVDENNIKVKTDKKNEIKKVGNILDNNEGVNSNIDTKSDCLTQLMTNSSTFDIINVYKNTSAIIKEASHTNHNDNDNKATTPIVVTKDQPHEAASIIPGSVKNYVKYYEIQSEICSIAKVKDNLFKKHSECEQEKNKTKLIKANEKLKKNTKNSVTPKKEDVKKAGIKFSDDANKIMIQNSPSPVSTPIPLIQKQSCLKTEPSPKFERRKSVQFDNEHIIMTTRKKDKENDKQKNKEEGKLSSFAGGITAKLTKNTSLMKSSVDKVEQQNGLKLDQHCNDEAAIICIQKSTEAMATSYSATPGNRSFLPQTKTPQSNQTIVFYCTL